jgi:alpha-1,6-mannosyltransferase
VKIVHIANFYSEKSGGIKTTIAQLGRLYQSQGHEFFYMVPGARYSVESQPNGTQITLPGFPIPFSGGYRIIRSNREVRKLLSLLKPERIEISDRLTLRRIGLWARRRSIHSVVFSHESLEELVKRFVPYKFVLRFVEWHNARLARSFDWVITSTEFAAREFRKLNIANLKKVPLGVDLETFQPMRRNLDLRKKLLQGEEILMVHCGRLFIEKNPEQSFRTFQELRRQGMRVRLIYVGMGPLYPRLMKLAEGQHVEFLGYVVSPLKVAEILASADVVLAPGPHETFCLAALEALACGTPVVASSRSAVGEILHNDRGMILGGICGDDPVEWASAVNRLLHQKGLRENCRSRAENFPWSSTISNLISTHDGIAA